MRVKGAEPKEKLAEVVLKDVRLVHSFNGSDILMLDPRLVHQSATTHHEERVQFVDPIELSAWEYPASRRAVQHEF
jgi:hypothetical protein